MTTTTRVKVDRFIQSSIASTEKIPMYRKPRRIMAAEGEENVEPKRFRGPRRNKKETKVIVVDANVKKLRKLRDGGVYRADRVLANRGWGSRSECFQLLMKKQVAILEDMDSMPAKHKKKVKATLMETSNQTGEELQLDPDDPSFRRVLQGPMERIALNSKLFVRGQPVPEIPLLMVYHKPKWMLSTMSDPQHPEPATASNDDDDDDDDEKGSRENQDDKDPSGEYDESGDWEDVEEKDDEEESSVTEASITTTEKTFADLRNMATTAADTTITATTTSTATTRGGRPNLGQILPPVYQRQKLHPVGRLDYDSSGLILFSSVGTLTQKLLHPSQIIEKEYRATVSGKPNLMALERQLAEGVSTADGVYTARLLSVNPVPADEVPDRLQHIINTLPPEYDRQELEEKGYLREVKTATHLSHVRLVVTEGKHRMVRRMLANLGFPVLELKRLRQGEVTLGDLPEGQFRFLTPQEQEWAEELMYRQWMKPQRGNLTTTTVPRRPKPRRSASNSTTTSASTSNGRTTRTPSDDRRGSSSSGGIGRMASNDRRASTTSSDRRSTSATSTRTASTGGRTITANRTATNKRLKTVNSAKSDSTRAPKSQGRSATSKGKRY